MSLRAYKKPGRQPCEIEGCEQPMYARQMCVMHYSRSRSTGDVGPATRRRAPRGSGHINPDGYRIIKWPGHPLATAQDKLPEHRAVLYAEIGPGQHGCHWCAKPLVWTGRQSECINVDHLDHDRLNNTPENLVPSCLDCNTKRRAAA